MFMTIMIVVRVMIIVVMVADWITPGDGAVVNRVLWTDAEPVYGADSVVERAAGVIVTPTPGVGDVCGQENGVKLSRLI